MGNRCPKCGGYVQHGDVRFGIAAPEISICKMCGLHSEQAVFYDAKLKVYRDMSPPYKVVSRALGSLYT
jgi:hypothetical protein